MENDKETHKLDEYVELSSFADIEIGIAAAKTINEVMEQVMHKIGEILSPLTHLLFLLERESGRLCVKLVRGQSADKLKNYKLSKDEGLAGWVLQYEKTDFIENVSKDSRYSKKIAELAGYEVKSTLCTPLKVTDKIIGVFQLINRANEKPYSAADLSVMETIVDYAAMAIEKVYYLSAMKDMDNIDSVTRVYKRRSFNHQFAKEAERAKRYNQPLSMIIVNIDNLKDINEKNGLAAGDQILKNLALLLKKNFRRVDVVARYSGDEFAILMPHTYKKNAELVRDRVAKDIERENKGGEIPFTVSIGLGSAGPKDSLNLLEKTEKDLQKQIKAKKPAKNK
ncbi:MAG: sensor domain-containing diguanylate cyclase [Candidatus Aminicenantes bacterium]|nr:sensor domain-containing diguanylate cyclase [Candidatus Aminicenantes bacterium]